MNDSVQWVVSISGENFTRGYTHCSVGSVTCVQPFVTQNGDYLITKPVETCCSTTHIT